MASLRRCDRLRQLTQADGAGREGAKKKNWTKIVTGLEECDLCETQREEFSFRKRERATTEVNLRERSRRKNVWYFSCCN